MKCLKLLCDLALYRLWYVLCGALSNNGVNAVLVFLAQDGFMMISTLLTSMRFERAQ